MALHCWIKARDLGKLCHAGFGTGERWSLQIKIGLNTKHACSFFVIFLLEFADTCRWIEQKCEISPSYSWWCRKIVLRVIILIVNFQFKLINTSNKKMLARKIKQSCILFTNLNCVQEKKGHFSSEWCRANKTHQRLWNLGDGYRLIISFYNEVVVPLCALIMVAMPQTKITYTHAPAMITQLWYM